MSILVNAHLEDGKIEASAPCRVDSGGTWDIKALALPMENIRPTTVNIALTLRTSVALLPYDEGSIKITSEGFSKTETCTVEQIPYNATFRLFFAAISYFGFHGLRAHIATQSPVKSALGGSSTALVALLKALSKLAAKIGDKQVSSRKLLHLAYHLEDGISGGNCGLQDQAAAVFGGVNQWIWQYGNPTHQFKRISLLNAKGKEELSKHLLVAYSGKRHVSSHTNRKWIKDFLSGRTAASWVKTNEIVHHLATAIKNQDWKMAASFLRDEMAVRKELTPEALIPITERLIHQAEQGACGARFAGAGAGGSLWAIGEAGDIRRLRLLWEKTLATVRDGRILDCDVDTRGVR